MQLFFTIVYIRIITLTRIFHDHPLVEYPLLLIFTKTHFNLFQLIYYSNNHIFYTNNLKAKKGKTLYSISM